MCIRDSDIPDAFVCDDDTMASGALRAFSEHGYKAVSYTHLPHGTDDASIKKWLKSMERVHLPANA